MTPLPWLWAAYRGIRASFDQCTKQCGVFGLNASKRQLCLQRCKLGTLNNMLKAFQRASSQDPKMKKKVIQTQQKIVKTQQEIKQLMASLKVAGRSTTDLTTKGTPGKTKWI